MRETACWSTVMDAPPSDKFIEDEGVRWKPVIEQAGLVEQ